MPIGPSSSAAPYLLGTEPNVRFTSIATVGDIIGTKPDESPYRMVGIPDGLGAYDNGDGTITVLMNHELGQTAGIVREHGAVGAFVSKLTINKTTLAVEAAEDAIKTVQLWNDAANEGLGGFELATYAIGRLCSADLAEQSAYYFVDTMGTVDTSDDIAYGTQNKIFMTGEEIGSEGKQFGVAIDGEDAGTAYELAHMGLFSWENSVSSPFAQRKTVNVSTDDSGGGQVYIYIGEKQTEGNTVEKAGLVGGDLFGLSVAGVTVEANGTIANGSFSLTKLGQGEDTNADGIEDTNLDGDTSQMTGVQLEAQSNALGVTKFLRPEDVHFDPTNDNVFYFVTTNSFNNPTRLYKATFTDIANPELGGTIEAVLDGTDGGQMFDNITVNAEGKVIIQEDPGNQSYHARVWEYDPVTDKLSQIAVHDPALFTTGLPGFKTQDEESSGVIDVTSLLGDADTKAYLLDVQAHVGLLDPELVQDGQLLAMYVDTPVTNGGAGDDILFGSFANETFYGRAGNDTMRGGSGNDRMDGGAGNDVIEGGRGDDAVTAGAGDDLIDLGDGNDKVQGGTGADVMLGGAGQDNLNGGDGADMLTGGAGLDILFGGMGADRFIFTAVSDTTRSTGVDVVKDFKHAEGDIIDLGGIDADTLTAGDQSFTLVDRFTNQAGQMTISAPAGSVRYLYGDVDGNGVADLVLQVNSATTLVMDDFVL